MPVTVVVGGQFGGEGKGKVAHFFAKYQQASVAVRTGGSNSGHTVVDQKGVSHIFRHLPTACILPDVELALGVGTYIDVDVLLSEINSIKLSEKRIHIDKNALIITSRHKELERQRLVGAISSTGSGTGAAVASRIMRENDVQFAKDIPELTPYIHDDVASFLRHSLNKKQRVIVEGTQGFGLSVLYSPYYPCATSRDTTAGTFIAEAGVSPLDVDEIVLTLRAFPIRVGGNSGELPNEVNWADVASEAGEPALMEYTTVTKKPRRVGRFDSEIVRKAIAINQPTKLIMNHLDYLGQGERGDRARKRFIQDVEVSLGHKIDYLGMDKITLLKSLG